MTDPGDHGVDLMALGRAYDFAVSMGLRFEPADEGRCWVELHCRCGATLAVPAQPQRPAGSAVRVLVFVGKHQHACRPEVGRARPPNLIRPGPA